MGVVLMGVCSLLFVVVGVYSWLLLKRNVAIAEESMKQLKSQRCSCLRARARLAPRAAVDVT